MPMAVWLVTRRSMSGLIAATWSTVAEKPPRSLITTIGVTTRATHMRLAWIVSVQLTARKPPI